MSCSRVCTWLLLVHLLGLLTELYDVPCSYTRLHSSQTVTQTKMLCHSRMSSAHAPSAGLTGLEPYPPPCPPTEEVEELL